MGDEPEPSVGFPNSNVERDPQATPGDSVTKGEGPTLGSSTRITTVLHEEEARVISTPPPSNGTAAGRPETSGGVPAPTAPSTSSTLPAESSLPRRPLTRSEAILAISSVIAWVILVAAGVAVTTKPYIDLISQPTATRTFVQLATAWFLVTTCYTFTNAAFLSCLSAVIGAIGRSARIADVERIDAATDLRSMCISAMIRGFFIFIVVLSGTLILSDQKYDNITIEQYLKLVGLLSLLSFTVGYDPSVFLAFFQRVGQWTNSVGTQPTRR
jgi:hypothetical protein